jgi:hypothetical protein
MNERQRAMQENVIKRRGPVRKVQVANPLRPLPHTFIEECRATIATGQHFSDWLWAQSALRRHGGWFEVRGVVDSSDPDCVLRRRRCIGGEVLEMWSPVRWVALLTLLTLALRWPEVWYMSCGDIEAWTSGAWGTAQANDEARYWLKKLRAWQEKYNHTDIAVKENRARYKQVMAPPRAYPRATYLFRTPEAGAALSHVPREAGFVAVLRCWHAVLCANEQRLVDCGQIDVNESMTRLLGAGDNFATLNCIRVSLAAELARH